MPDVLLAADSEGVRAEVRSVLSALPDTRVREVDAGAKVLPAVLQRTPDLVVLDQQIGNMGAMATCLDLRLEQSADRIGHVPVLILLDRRADVFLARRSGAEAWIVKPLDPIRLRRAITAALAGGTYHDETHKPQPVVVGGTDTASG